MTATKPASVDYAAEMRLPDGKTCANCEHGLRCDALFGAVRHLFTSCDFWPSRYVAKRSRSGEKR